MAIPTTDAATALSLLETIITGRRNIKEFADRPVPRDLIARLIDLAVWAPNHRLTEPWRFYIFDGPARARLGEVARQVTLDQFLGTPGVSHAVAETKAAEAAATWSQVPVLLYVTTLPDPNPEIDLENYGSTCIAVTNVMLAAHAAGLATSWSSGLVAAAPALAALVGAGADERMVGLVRLGYPDPAAAPRAGKRAPGASRLTWVGNA